MQTECRVGLAEKGKTSVNHATKVPKVLTIIQDMESMEDFDHLVEIPIMGPTTKTSDGPSEIRGLERK